MPYEASWLRAPDFAGASQAGFRLGLARQEMLERANEHAAELALQADVLRQRSSEQAASRAQEQGQFDAGLSLRRDALRQQGISDQQKFGVDQSRADSVKEFNQAKIAAMNRKPVMDAINQNVRTSSLDNLPQLMSAHPEMSKPEILSRFPMLRGADIPSRQKPPAIKPLLPAGVQDALFKMLLSNSRGGTNVDDAVTGLQRYMQPATDVGATVTPDESAGASLAPTAESVDGLPASPAAPTAAAPAVPTVNSQDEYDALAPGAAYLDSNGNLAHKRAAR